MAIKLPVLLFVLTPIFSGCGIDRSTAIRHIAESPKVFVDGTKSHVELTGDHKEPANVDTKKSDSLVKIPQGSTIVFNEKLGTLTLTFAKASDLTVNRTETKVEGPVAFTPDKAPTIAEELSAKSDAKLRIWYNIGMVAGLAAAAFGLTRNWDLVMIGGAIVAGACAFASFVQDHPWVKVAIGAGVAAAIIGPILWKTKLKKNATIDTTNK